VLGDIIGNWQITGITVLQSGPPLRIAAADNTNLYDFSLSVGRANRNGTKVNRPVLAP
jgi:hypothetical protein